MHWRLSRYGEVEDCNKDPCVRLFFACCFLLLPCEKEKPDTQAKWQRSPLMSQLVALKISWKNIRERVRRYWNWTRYTGMPANRMYKSYLIVFPSWFALGCRYFYAHWLLGSIVLFQWICWRQASKPKAIACHLQHHKSRNRNTAKVKCDVPKPVYRKRQNCHCLWHILYLSCLQKNTKL